MIEKHILYYHLKNDWKKPTWNTSRPVWSFIVIVVVAVQNVAMPVEVGGKSVVTPRAACVVEMTTSAARTWRVVVSDSQICFWRWIRSIETVDHWGKDMEEIFISTHVCREAMNLYSRSDRSGILNSARLRSFRRSSQIQSQVPCIGTFGGNQQDFNVDLLNIRIIIHIVSIPVKRFNVCSNTQVNQFRLLA